MSRLTRFALAAGAAGALALSAASGAVAKGKPSPDTIANQLCTINSDGSWALSFTWTQKGKNSTPTGVELFNSATGTQLDAGFTTQVQQARSFSESYGSNAPPAGVYQMTLFSISSTGAQTNLGTASVTCG